MANQYCNFVDVLARGLMLAKDNGATIFVSDPVAWQNAVFEAKDRFSEKLPLLRQLAFDRSQTTPYSEGVEHFIHVMLQSRRFEAVDNGYRFAIGSRRACQDEKPSWDETALLELSELLSSKLSKT